MIEHMIRGNVITPDDLRGEDGEYFAGSVNVAGDVHLSGLGLERLPVKFGTVSGYFHCSNNLLTSLEGAPGTVGRHFSCSNNRLTSLEGAPGAVGGDFYYSKNRLTSLVGAHKILRRVGGILYIWNNPITSGGIGLVLVEGLTGIDTDHPAFEIIRKYLGQGNKGLLRCQEALHEAGFGEFAQL